MVFISLLAACGTVLALALFLPGAAAPVRANPDTRFVAPTGTDSGDCTSTPCQTIQYAVNQSSDGDDIQIAAGTYTERIDLDGITVTLTGAGAATTIIDGTGVANDDSTVEVTNGSVVQIAGVTVQNGEVGGSFAGGGVKNVSSTLTLNQVTLYNNVANGDGGGIYSSHGTLVLKNSILLSNTASGGGGIANLYGSVLVSNTAILSNTAFGVGGGGISSSNAGATLQVINSTVAGNVASAVLGLGGGIDNAQVMTLTNTLVTTNTSGSSGGGISNSGSAWLSGVTLRNNQVANSPYDGGGIFNSDGVMYISAGSIISNTAPDLGGGLYNYETQGQVTLVDVTVVDNVAGYQGGGVYNNDDCHLTLTGSTFRDNVSTNSGGAIYNRGTLTATNSTLSGNGTGGDGGGLYNNVGTAVLANTTVAGNTANTDGDATGDGGGLFQGILGGAINVVNTLVGSNTDAGGSNIHPDCSGTLTSLDYNLVQDTTGCTLSGPTANTITGQNPQIGPLQDNGGATWTHALLKGSPAIDEGTDAGCPATDQRGVGRASPCDIGAYEYRTCWARVGTDPTDYGTIQAAVDAANPGALVKVAGTCTGVTARAGVTQVVYISKTVTLQGGYTTTNDLAGPPDPQANPTVLDAEYQGRVLYVTGSINPVIQGLRVTRGDATDQGGAGIWDGGGGAYVNGATVTVSDCHVYDNFAGGFLSPSYGGGVYLLNSTAILQANTIDDNACGLGGDGGGVYVESGAATLMDNTFVDNQAAGNGGGLYVGGGTGAHLEDNTFIRNGASLSSGGGVYLSMNDATLQHNDFISNTAFDSGGGLLIESSAANLRDNTIISNTATDGVGGGLCLDTSPVMLTGNSVLSNTAGNSGGGLYLSGSSGAVISGNLVCRNLSNAAPFDIYGGGGLYLTASDATIRNNTICSNVVTSYGGGVYLYDSDSMVSDNRVFGNHTQNDGGGVYVESSGAALSGNRVTSNTAAYYGAGLYLYRSPTTTLWNNVVVTNSAADGGGGVYLFESDAAFTNTVIADNQCSSGSGVYIDDSSPRLWHTTLSRNHGGGSGVYVAGAGNTVWMTNTIVAYHTAGVTVTAGNAAVLNGTLWHGNGVRWSANVTHTNDHAGDPAFAADGYHLTSSSAAKDKGVDAGVDDDVDGDPRPTGSQPDLGADELGDYNIFLPLVLRNG